MHLPNHSTKEFTPETQLKRSICSQRNEAMGIDGWNRLHTTDGDCHGPIHGQ